MVYDHRLIGEVHDRLRHCECEGAQSCAISSDQDQCFHAVTVNAFPLCGHLKQGFERLGGLRSLQQSGSNALRSHRAVVVHVSPCTSNDCRKCLTATNSLCSCLQTGICAARNHAALEGTLPTAAHDRAGWQVPQLHMTAFQNGLQAPELCALCLVFSNAAKLCPAKLVCSPECPDWAETTGARDNCLITGPGLHQQLLGTLLQLK